MNHKLQAGIYYISIRDISEFIKSGVICGRAYFLIGNFEKATNLLQGVLKVSGRCMEALYWEGMNTLFTYRDEQGSLSKVNKLKHCEYCLLGKLLLFFRGT